jgi:predicted nucleic acid-binding protein
LDTNIVSYQIKQHPLEAVYAPLLAGYDAAIAHQSLAELLEGAELAGWGSARRARLEARISTIALLPVDRAVCKWHAYVQVVRRRPISPQDAWIAASALAYGLELVTHNPRDFDRIPGLVVLTAGP